MKRWGYVALIVWSVILVRFAVIQTQAAKEVFVWDMQGQGGWQINRSGEYKNVLSYSAAREMLLEAAESFGVASEGKISFLNKDNGSVTRYEKQGSNWELVMEYTVIKGESIWETAQSYVSLSLCMNEDGDNIINSCEAYRKLMDAWCEERNINGQTATFYTFEREGILSEEEQQEWCGQILESCEGKRVAADYSGNTYLLYGYTEHFDRYMKLNGEKININLAVFVQEQENRTVMQVGIPYIPF